MRKEIAVVSANAADLESGIAMLQKGFETSFKPHVEANARLTKALGKMRNNLGKKTREFLMVRAMIVKFK